MLERKMSGLEKQKRRMIDELENIKEVITEESYKHALLDINGIETYDELMGYEYKNKWREVIDKGEYITEIVEEALGMGIEVDEIKNEMVDEESEEDGYADGDNLDDLEYQEDIISEEQYSEENVFEYDIDGESEEGIDSEESIEEVFIKEDDEDADVEEEERRDIEDVFMDANDADMYEDERSNSIDINDIFEDYSINKDVMDGLHIDSGLGLAEDTGLEPVGNNRLFKKEKVQKTFDGVFNIADKVVGTTKRATDKAKDIAKLEEQMMISSFDAVDVDMREDTDELELEASVENSK